MLHYKPKYEHNTNKITCISYLLPIQSYPILMERPNLEILIPLKKSKNNKIYIY